MGTRNHLLTLAIAMLGAAFMASCNQPPDTGTSVHPSKPLVPRGTEAGTAKTTAAAGLPTLREYGADW